MDDVLSWVVLLLAAGYALIVPRLDLAPKVHYALAGAWSAFGLVFEVLYTILF